MILLGQELDLAIAFHDFGPKKNQSSQLNFFVYLYPFYCRRGGPGRGSGRSWFKTITCFNLFGKLVQYTSWPRSQYFFSPCKKVGHCPKASSIRPPLCIGQRCNLQTGTVYKVFSNTFYSVAPVSLRSESSLEDEKIYKLVDGDKYQKHIHIPEKNFLASTNLCAAISTWPERSTHDTSLEQEQVRP